MYEQFFGLADAPFRLTPDPRYLFLSRKHADALAHLKLGLSESSGFVCITGDVATGKTTLLRAFLTGPIPDTATAYVFNPVLSPLELLQTINAEFGLPADTDSRTELVGALNRHLLAQRQAGRRAIVVIDEAQALAVEVLEQLRLLSNLETTTEKLLRIILVGQPQLRTLLLHPELVQLNQRITLRWHIGPLPRQETGAYIQHRLSIASPTQPGPIFPRPPLGGTTAARRRGAAAAGDGDGLAGGDEPAAAGRHGPGAGGAGAPRARGGGAATRRTRHPGERARGVGRRLRGMGCPSARPTRARGGARVHRRGRATGPRASSRLLERHHAPRARSPGHPRAQPSRCRGS